MRTAAIPRARIPVRGGRFPSRNFDGAGPTEEAGGATWVSAALDSGVTGQPDGSPVVAVPTLGGAATLSWATASPSGPCSPSSAMALADYPPESIVAGHGDQAEQLQRVHRSDPSAGRLVLLGLRPR